MRNVPLYVAFLVFLTVAPAARAQTPAPAATPTPAVPAPAMEPLPATPAEAIAALQEGGGASRLRAAVQILSVAPPREAVPALVAFIEGGPTDPLTDEAIRTLGALADRGGVRILLELLSHRRVGVRLLAIDALAGIIDPRVAPGIEEALSDSDARVRGAASLALGRMGSRASMPVLQHAYDRGVPEAAVALGKMGDVEVARRAASYLRRRPLAEVLAGFREFLVRADFPEDAKVNLVDLLFDIAGPEVKRFLRDYAATIPRTVRGRLRQAVEDAIRRIPDEPSPGGGAR